MLKFILIQFGKVTVKMKLTNNAYDILKYIAIVGLPAFTTLVGTIGTQLGYEMTTVIVILTALDTFLGTLLGLSGVTYTQAKQASAQAVSAPKNYVESTEEINQTYTLKAGE